MKNSIFFYKELTTAEVGNAKTHETYVRLPNDFDYASFFYNRAVQKGTVIEYEFMATNLTNGHNEQVPLKFVYYNNSNREKRIPSLSPLFAANDVQEGDIVCLESRKDGTDISYFIRFYKKGEISIKPSPIYFTSKDDIIPFNKNKFELSEPSIEWFSKYLAAIRTKPFILLAGISGTGKSQIVKEMAFATCPDIDDLQIDKTSPGNYCLIEVKPNWHDSTELLGYDSAIKKRYVVTKFVKFVVKAMRYPNVPFFVCLDEMNLAPVEQYFAEFLSVLESRKLIGDEIYSEPLIDKAFFQDTLLEYDLFDIPLPRTGEMSISKAGDNNAGLEDYAYTWRRLQHEGLCIPQNLIVIGTVNMDETTHQFSRKVIDRAMTFEMNEANFDSYFEDKVTLDYVDEPLDAALFLARNVSGNRAIEEINNLIEDFKPSVAAMLNALNVALKDTPFKIAYRVQNELILYFAELLRENADADQERLLAAALDDIMMMKVLPRIEGDDELLGNRTEGALSNLMQFASTNNLEHSVEKIDEMLKRLERSHFTSFWP